MHLHGEVTNKDKKVELWSQINDSEYEAEIKGNRKALSC